MFKIRQCDLVGNTSILHILLGLLSRFFLFPLPSGTAFGSFIASMAQASFPANMT